MKKFKKIYLSILFSALVAFGGIAVGNFTPQKNVALAQNTNLPANATFAKYTSDDGEFTLIPNTNISYQDAVFIESGQVVIFEIGNPDRFEQNLISDIVVDVYLDSFSTENIDLEIKDISVGEDPYQWLQIVFDLNKPENPAVEGKYEINLEYFDRNVVKQTLRQTFYLYKQSTYKTNNLPAVSVQNVNRTTPAMSTASFARTHEFHYTNDATSAQNLALPTITFNSSKFEIGISKNHSGITQDTYISLDNNGNVIQTQPLVLAKKDGENIVVTFNNLGSYTVNYYMLYKNGTEKFLFANQNALLKPDRMQMFGFQAYHSNINATTTAEQQKEFKVITENNTIDPKHQTDITFTQIQNRYLNSINNTTGDKLYTYNSENNYTLNNIDSRVLFKKTTSAQSTNQAPVSFQYNGTLKISPNSTIILNPDSQSYSFYFKLDDKNESGDNIWQLHKYDGSSFSDVGTYLLKLTYTSDLSTTPSTEFTQWFYFTISNQIPNHSVTANGENLSTGSFTKEVVEVAFKQSYNPFDSASRLRVYRQDTLQSASTLVTEVEYNHLSTFSQNGIYTVELSRGRNYQSKNTSQFIIDSTPITGLVARDVTNVNNNPQKGSASGFYTNQSVAVEWNNKTTNGNTVSAFYKYIPLKQLSPITDHKSHYDSYYIHKQLIPVQYGLNYEMSGGNYPTLSAISYANTLNQTLNNSNTFTQEGLYLVNVTDKAGNEAFTYFFIDKTTPVILQIDGDNNYLTDYSKLNIVSETVTVRWGNYKAIKTSIDLSMLDFDAEEENKAGLDDWLFEMLKAKANTTQIELEDGDFKTPNLGGLNVLHFTPKIDVDNIMVAVGNDGLVRLTDSLTYPGLERIGNHSVSVSATTQVGGVLTDIGTSYTFYINDESNKNTTPSSIYNIDTSTDVSKTQVVFKPENSDFFNQTLTAYNYRVANANESTLQSYFVPINTEKLQLQFITTTDESSIEIETILVYYYPYISNYLVYSGSNSMLNKGAPTFYTLEEKILYTGENKEGLDQNKYYTLEYLIDKEVFKLSDFTVGRSLTLAKTPIEIEVYNYHSGTNLARIENGTWVWDIHPEDFYVNNMLQERTMAGKYEIVRTYRQNENTSATLKDKADYMVRHLTFILEREDVISRGIDKEIDGINQTFSLVGGSAFIEILAGSNNPSKFTALYTARTYTPQMQAVILQTNKLPVKLGFPIAKFGQVINNNFELFSNNFFYTNNKETYINAFEMGLRVTNLRTNEVVSSNLKITVSTELPIPQNFIKLDNGLYLIFENAEKGYLRLEKDFREEGKYKVEFFQQNTALRGKTSSMSLFFEIINIAPNFDVVDEFGVALPKHDTSDIFYANQNQVRITWTDSTNPYYAKINQNAISYTINGTYTKLNSSNINTLSDGITHYFFIQTPANLEGAEIVVRMQYEGDERDYAQGMFSKSKTIIVDKTAPIASINNLIAKMGDASLFNAESLRQGHNAPVRYNRTITTGRFAEFAFAVDMSNLQSLVLVNLNQETSRLYYKEVVGKYSGSPTQEQDPSLPNAFSQIDANFTRYHPESTFNPNTYYEFAEVDKAGNISIYTIYLTDIANTIEQEQQLKNQNIDYKESLQDSLKLINYTSQQKDDVLTRFETALSVAEQNNGLKIYAKQFFNLSFINPYGYQWSLLTFGTNKYLASPFLENQVYKIAGGVWTPVSFKNELYLTVARNNYVFELKNLPAQNISINVTVSNNELLFQEPQASNPTLTIINTVANDAEYVRWQSVSVWEYQNGKISAFARFVPSQAEPIEREPELEGFNLATYSVNGLSTLFNINTKNQAYYRFKIVDNFGTEYIMYHLAGTQFINQIEELEGRELITDNALDNTTYYISNSGFKYTYYPAITQSVVVSITVFDLETQQYALYDTYTLESGSLYIDEQFGKVDIYTNYNTITLRPAQQPSSKYSGFAVIYNITSNTLASTNANEDVYERSETNFKVYSVLPKTILTGKNRQDLSEILLKNEGIISEPITISFESTASFDYPVKVFLSYNNQTETELQSGQVFIEAGNYTIRKVFAGAMSIYSNVIETFAISDEASTFFTVVQFDEFLNRYVDVKQTPQPYILEKPLGFDQTLITQHYIVNTTDWKINPSHSQFIEVVDNEGEFIPYEEVRKNGVTTFIKTISNTHVESENKSFSYYKTVIAITYIPQHSKLLTDFYYLDNQAEHINLIDPKLPGFERIYALEKNKDISNKVEIYWNAYHLIPENKITASIYFGQDRQLSSSIIKTRGSNNYVTLTRSGNYSFVFEDQAGNVHKFDYNSQITESTSAYEFVFLNSVIFTVNEQAPIQRAIYNQSVVIKIPSHTMPYYDNNAKPVILVMKDNKVITDYTTNLLERSYTFTKPGLYKITFNAKISGNEIKEEPYIFEIIKEKEIAELFNVAQFGDYHIEKIEKNNIDVTEILSNATLGNIVSIQKDGKTIQRLKNILISLYDEQTGAGVWKITISTNNDLNQFYSFTFTISDTNPPIVISHPLGAQTTDKITVSFNARNLYQNVGEALIKVGSREIYLSEEYFEGDFIETHTIEITKIGDSYVQIFTPSGRLVYTYRVTRQQPLNSVAIIVIVISSLAAIGLTVLFVLLRRRMKIR